MVKKQATARGAAQAAREDGGSNRDRLLRVAAELFATKGFHATAMSDLEKASGLGRGSLYYLISSKEELLFEVTSRYLLELIDFGKTLLATEMSAEQRLRQLSRGVMRAIVEHLAELTVCFREVHSVAGERRMELLDLHRSYEKIWTDVLKAGVEEGVFRTADPLVVKALLGQHHYSYLWLRPGGSRSPEDVADLFCDLTLLGLKVEPDGQHG
ncbi:MAG: TetR/AcrR family transcriptional regulator [Halomonas sp.]|uniref:TetR/AcrR family transcriptional regulator n=1 Tax=Halomonas sp. TaxID=1486246 RepID=UPI003F930741